MLTENIRFVWFRPSYSADKYGDVADAGRTDERSREDSATQSMDSWTLETEFHNTVG